MMNYEFLEKFHLHNIPEYIYYIPNFINEIEEKNIVSKTYNVPKPKWTQLLNRRLQNWGGVPHHKGMIAESIPDWLQTFVDKINDLNLMGGRKANHVLLNEYNPGQGIMPHLDGELFYPTITTLSCNSHTIINFHKKTNDGDDFSFSNETYSVLLEPRSLFIVQSKMFHDYLHGIEELHEDLISEKILNLDKCAKSYEIGEKIVRQTRISLTIRHVPKTTKTKIKL